MAWFAKIAEEIVADNAVDRLMSIVFYDDAAPTVPLWHKTYSTSEVASLADLRAAVIADGQAARARWLKMQAARSQLPVGATVAIP
jgi:hypothetical protein